MKNKSEKLFSKDTKGKKYEKHLIHLDYIDPVDYFMLTK